MKIKALHLRETARLGMHYSKLWQVGAQGVESIETTEEAGGGFVVKVGVHTLTENVEKVLFLPSSMVEHAEYAKDAAVAAAREAKVVGKVPAPPSA